MNYEKFTPANKQEWERIRDIARWKGYGKPWVKNGNSIVNAYGNAIFAVYGEDDEEQLEWLLTASRHFDHAMCRATEWYWQNKKLKARLFNCSITLVLAALIGLANLIF